MEKGMEFLASEYDRDIIEAASSDTYFDKANVNEISDRHGIERKAVRPDIKACRLKEYKRVFDENIGEMNLKEPLLWKGERR
jgi:hypothetical protein